MGGSVGPKAGLEAVAKKKNNMCPVGNFLIFTGNFNYEDGLGM
jgi:hypothetical protein